MPSLNICHLVESGRVKLEHQVGTGVARSGIRNHGGAGLREGVVTDQALAPA